MSQRGNALVEFSWLAIAMMIPIVWIVMAVFEVQQASFELTSAARSASRAYVLAPSDEAGRRAATQAVGVATAGGPGEDRRVEVGIRCTPRPRACHSATSIVTAQVTTSVKLPWVPESWGLGRPMFRLAAEHSVPVGQFQAGR